MRILLLTHYYAPEIGAPQRRWAGLVAQWQALGHEVTVLTSMPHYPSPGLTAPLRRGLRPFRPTRGTHGETIVRFPFFPHGYGVLPRTADHVLVGALSALAGPWLVGRDHDVVVASVPGLPTMLVGQILARACRARLVVEMRDAWPDLLTHTPLLQRRNAAAFAFRTLVHRSVTAGQRHAAAVVTTTRAFATVLAERGVRRPVVIRNGAILADTPDLTGSGGPTRTGGPLRVLYLGTMGRSQGLEAVIRAVDLARRQGTRIHLRMVGEGARREELRALAERLGAPVEFVDQVPREMVNDHYRWADTVVVSLRSWQPFEWTVPSKLYEVLATNRHVSALVSGEAAQIIRDAQGGFVADAGDSAALAAHWGALARDRAGLAPSGRARAWVAEHADYARLARKYLDVLAGRDEGTPADD